MKSISISVLIPITSLINITMSSRSSQQFLNFTGDLITCALRKHNIEWKITLPDSKAHSPHIFKPSFADAVLICRSHFENNFLMRIHDCPEPILDRPEAFIRYVHLFVKENFNGKVFLLEVLRLFAFVVDLSLFCHKNKREKCINLCAELVEYAYIEYIEEPFKTVGGYTALYNLADQYIDFYKSDAIKDEMSGSSGSKETAVETASCISVTEKSHWEILRENANRNVLCDNSQTATDSDPSKIAIDNVKEGNTTDNRQHENPTGNGDQECGNISGNDNGKSIGRNDEC